jgi:hypothetical protein
VTPKVSSRNAAILTGCVAATRDTSSHRLAGAASVGAAVGGTVGSTEACVGSAGGGAAAGAQPISTVGNSETSRATLVTIEWCFIFPPCIKYLSQSIEH